MKSLLIDIMKFHFSLSAEKKYLLVMIKSLFFEVVPLLHAFWHKNYKNEGDTEQTGSQPILQVSCEKGKLTMKRGR